MRRLFTKSDRDEAFTHFPKNKPMPDSDKRILSFTKIIFSLAALMPTVEAQTCTNECCWVVSLWKAFGQSTNVSVTDNRGCCSMTGVKCSGVKVAQIKWENLDLHGTIPASIGNLANIQIL